MRTNQHIKKMIIAALFAALTCIAAVALHTHFPGSPHGCISPSDGVVLISGVLLGPLYGPIAAGMGAAFGDLFMGHLDHALGTFIFKFLSALIAFFVYRLLSKEKDSYNIVPVTLAGLAGELVMIAGFFLYDGILHGSFGASVLNIPANCVQAIIGITMSVIVIRIMKKANIIDMLKL